MQEDNRYPKRKSPRLKEFDYSNNGYYFITICVKDNKSVFGDVKNFRVILNENGHIIDKILNDLPLRFPMCSIDYYIIMPNHIHFILVLENKYLMECKSVTEIVGVFKSLTTIEIHKKGRKDFKWQRSFYDRVIRNEKELFLIRRYIEQNPLRWEIERENPENLELD